MRRQRRRTGKVLRGHGRVRHPRVFLRRTDDKQSRVVLPLSVLNSPVIFSPLLSRLLLSPLLTPLFPHPSLYSNSSSSSWPPSSLSSSSSSCRCSSSSSSSTCSTCSGRACSRSPGLHPARLPCQDRPCNRQVSEGRRALVECFFFYLCYLRILCIPSLTTPAFIVLGCSSSVLLPRLSFST